MALFLWSSPEGRRQQREQHMAETAAYRLSSAGRSDSLRSDRIWGIWFVYHLNPVFWNQWSGNFEWNKRQPRSQKHDSNKMLSLGKNCTSLKLWTRKPAWRGGGVRKCISTNEWDLKAFGSTSLRKMIKENSKISICKMLSFSWCGNPTYIFFC